MKLLFEISTEGRRAFSLPPSGIPEKAPGEWIPSRYLRRIPAGLPEVSEVDIVRHFTGLSRRNFGVDTGFYPLGSCTMKYNPKVNETIAGDPRWKMLHPLQPCHTAQGALELLFRLDKMLCEVTGMDRTCLQPAAGAQGEMAGLMVMRAYHEDNGGKERDIILCPDSAHGTNPASAAMAGFRVVQIPGNGEGTVDAEALEKAMNQQVAGLMLTNPNTLGLFEKDILKISRIVHGKGGLLYYDGANANAILGIARPGDMGFDVVHLNLHKTFSTPHGGGGPGSGPIGVKRHLIPYLPGPLVEQENDAYVLRESGEKSVGRIHSFHGHFLVMVRAYAYLLTMGNQGLRAVAEQAVLNANYLLSRLKEHFSVPYDRRCMHEFVLSGENQKKEGVSTLDMAKRLMDFGMHPPTIYFPLTVKEAIMIEPTETEGKETLDAFLLAMTRIAEEAREQPERVKGAPHTTPVKRLDETRAARNPVLKWEEGAG